MSRPKIKTALILAFAIMGLIFACFATLALVRMADINKGTADIAGNWMRSLGFAKDADRAGSVCLNSFGRFAKWISTSIMPPPSLVSAR
jgi:hypothetical protein